MDRHLGLLGAGRGRALQRRHDQARRGRGRRAACARSRSRNWRTTAATRWRRTRWRCGAALSMMGIGFQPLDEVLTQQFQRKGEAVVTRTSSVARAGYDYATQHFQPFARPLPMTDNRYAVLTGNTALAMGGAAAGVKFYCAYPMSPSTGVLHWMAAPRAQGRHHGPPGRGRDRRHQHGDRRRARRRARHVRHLGRRLRADDRRPRHVRHDRDSGGGHRRPARRPVHRRADQDRAGRPLADAGRRPGRLSAGHRRADRHSATASRSFPRSSTWPTASSARASSCPTCCSPRAPRASIRRSWTSTCRSIAAS